MFSFLFFYLAIVSQPSIIKPTKPKTSESYTVPQFVTESIVLINRLAEVDPEERKKERIEKFFKSEVVVRFYHFSILGKFKESKST